MLYGSVGFTHIGTSADHFWKMIWIKGKGEAVPVHNKRHGMKTKVGVEV